MEQEKKDNSKVTIFGHSFQRWEVGLNGLAFLIIQSIYEAIYLAKQLPDDWSSEDLVKVDRAFWIPVILLVCSWLMIELAIFGGKENFNKLIEKNGKFRTYLFKYSLMFLFFSISLYLPLFLLKTLF